MDAFDQRTCKRISDTNCNDQADGDHCNANFHHCGYDGRIDTLIVETWRRPLANVDCMDCCSVLVLSVLDDLFDRCYQGANNDDGACQYYKCKEVSVVP